ncbi:hypothetical protein VAE122_2630008 [Vibrio aestuarianus]|nr:hypothetical protein VAE122_2630008 [Vibrio aestuarianus]
MMRENFNWLLGTSFLLQKQKPEFDLKWWTLINYLSLRNCYQAQLLFKTCEDAELESGLWLYLLTFIKFTCLTSDELM